MKLKHVHTWLLHVSILSALLILFASVAGANPGTPVPGGGPETRNVHTDYDAGFPGIQPSVSPQSVPEGPWQAVTPLNSPRSRLGMAYFPGNGKFYVLGGESAGTRDIPIEEYDMAADTWTNRTNLLIGVSNTGAATVGKYIYVPGGYDGAGGRTDMQRFDPAAGSVDLVAAMPAANFAHAVVAGGNKVYVMGGSSSGIDGTTNFIYDPAANSWTAGAPVPIPIRYPAAAFDGRYVYLIGSFTDAGTDSNIVQRYNPATDTWAPSVAPMTTDRGGPAAFFDGKRVWAVGGGWVSYLSSTEYFMSGAWTSGPAVLTGARTMAAACGKGVALKAGGWNGTYLAAAEKLDISSFSWPMFLPSMTKTIRP